MGPTTGIEASIAGKQGFAKAIEVPGSIGAEVIIARTIVAMVGEELVQRIEPKLVATSTASMEQPKQVFATTTRIVGAKP